jgi:hypothetical protein
VASLRVYANVRSARVDHIGTTEIVAERLSELRSAIRSDTFANDAERRASTGESAPVAVTILAGVTNTGLLASAARANLGEFAKFLSTTPSWRRFTE